MMSCRCEESASWFSIGSICCFFFQAEDGIRDYKVTGVQTCALPICWIASRCGWTPYDGIETMGWPVATILRGRLVMRDDRAVDPPGGQALRFLETLRDRKSVV